MGRRAIIMDLGGTVCGEVGDADDLESVRLLPGSAAAIRTANERGFQTILAAEAEDKLHERIRELLDREGARLDGIYGRRDELFWRARDEMGIDLTASYTIGDRGLDLEEGHRAGTTNVLVLTGRGRDELAHHAHAWRVPPDHVAPDLRAAVDWILGREVAP